MRAAFAVAVPLGLVAALNPCAFPLLPGWLALIARRGSAQPSTADAVRAALRSGAALTAAFLAVFAAAGALASAVLGAVLAVAPGVLLALGLLLVVGAVLTATGHPVRIPAPSRLPAGLGAAAGFGAVYAVASLGCALPLFLTAVGGAAATAGWAGPLVAGLGYALGMGLLVTAAGLVTACAGATAARRMGAAGRLVVPLGVVLQAVCGAGLAAVGLRDLGVPLPAWLSRLQSDATAWLVGDATLACAVLGAVLVAGTAALALAAARADRVGAAR